MAKTKVEFKGLKKLQKAFDPGVVTPILKKHIQRANQLNGMLAVARIRKTINEGKFKPNAPLTAAIKGENKPLVGKTVGGAGGQLFQSVAWKVEEWSSVYVGVFKTHSYYNIAHFIHEGGQIGVTNKMRTMFYYLWLASAKKIPPSDLKGSAVNLWKMMPGGWRRIHERTKAITVPGRPFITQALSDSFFASVVRNNWTQAAHAALKEVTK